MTVMMALIIGKLLGECDNMENNNSLIKRNSKSLAQNTGEWLLNKEIRDDNAGSYSAFSKKIAQIKRLSEEEEKELGLRVKNYSDKTAQQKLVLHNMRLALKMAHQYKREWTNIMDLVQEASFGMAIAAKKWDPEMETRFGTYAVYWIRAQLTKFLMNNARLIHASNTRVGRKLYFRLPVIEKKLLLEGKTPTAELVAKELDEDPKEVSLLMQRLKNRESSLSAPMDFDNDMSLEETIDNNLGTPESLTSTNEIQDAIKKVIASFESTLTNERDKEIWHKHLISEEPMSLVDLGKKYNVSKQRIGQLVDRIKKSFRCHIIDKLGPKTKLFWLFN